MSKHKSHATLHSVMQNGPDRSAVQHSIAQHKYRVWAGAIVAGVDACKGSCRQRIAPPALSHYPLPPTACLPAVMLMAARIGQVCLPGHPALSSPGYPFFVVRVPWRHQVGQYVSGQAFGAPSEVAAALRTVWHQAALFAGALVRMVF